jgi:hypothetical protein
LVVRDPLLVSDHAGSSFGRIDIQAVIAGKAVNAFTAAGLNALAAKLRQQDAAGERLL